jgi:hypothetical protein
MPSPASKPLRGTESGNGLSSNLRLPRCPVGYIAKVAFETFPAGKNPRLIRASLLASYVIDLLIEHLT